MNNSVSVIPIGDRRERELQDRESLAAGEGTKFGLSALDLVPLVQGGSSLDAVRGAFDLAVALDWLGYTRLWYAEHHNMPGIASSSPELLIARVGALTSRIRLGAGGVMLPNHSALQVAETFKLLDAMNPGRIDLGIGRAPGTDPRTAQALRGHKGTGADDFLVQLSELLAWDGEHYPSGHSFSGIRAMPNDRPLPPIFLLGSSDYGAHVAAGLGIGFAFAGHFSADPPDFAMRAYRSEFYTQGALQKPHAILALSVFCAGTEEAARRMASSMLLSFVRLRTGRVGRMPDPDEATAYVYTAQEQEIVSFFKRLAIVGTPEQVHAQIDAVARRTDADEVMIATHAFDPSARVRSYELVAQVFDVQQKAI